jgi:tRNA U34 2-thiouridine synthase MnmA/TrmU
MENKGQIVEIPAESLLYKIVLPSDLTKESALKEISRIRNYSLFDGFFIGEHSGLSNFILGQRRGINAGGKKAPLYVIAMDLKENRLFVGEGKNHPGLFLKILSFDQNETNYFSPELLNNFTLNNGLSVKVFSESLSNEFDAELYFFNEKFYLEFENKVPIIIKNHSIQIFKKEIKISEINKYI